MPHFPIHYSKCKTIKTLSTPVSQQRDSHILTISYRYKVPQLLYTKIATALCKFIFIMFNWVTRYMKSFILHKVNKFLSFSTSYISWNNQVYSISDNLPCGCNVDYEGIPFSIHRMPVCHYPGRITVWPCIIKFLCEISLATNWWFSTCISIRRHF